MSKVSKKTGSIWKLAEFVMSRLDCSTCRNTTASYDDDSYELAERAHRNGWRLDNHGHVKCPECAKKK